MKISEIPVKEEDRKLLAVVKSLAEDIWLLNKNSSIAELGELLQYLSDKYGKQLTDQILSSKEIVEIQQADVEEVY